ncbi:MAG: M28 family peptidase [Promethearchaeota archaeon]
MSKSSRVDMMGIINELAYPRYSGTEGDEVRCKEYLANKFKGLGQEPVIEPVPWSSFSTNVLLRAIVAILAAAMITSVLLYILDFPVVNIIFMLSFIACLVLAVNMQQSRTDSFARMGKQSETYNIFAKLPAKNTSPDKKIRDIIFMGHHDTKSQKVVTLVRMTSYLLGFIISIALAMFIILTSILRIAGVAVKFTTAMKMVYLVVLLVDLVPLSILMYNKSIVGESLGCLDNATSIAIIMKLLEHFREPLETANLWFLITGAEEHGMCGAIEFMRKHEGELKEIIPDRTAVFNFDMVAGGFTIIEHFGFPRAPYNTMLNDMIKDSAKNLNIPLHTFWLPMMGTTDGWITKNHGCDTADIITDKMARYTHSGRDTAAVCDEKTMAEAVKVTIDVVKKLVHDL